MYDLTTSSGRDTLVQDLDNLLTGKSRNNKTLAEIRDSITSYSSPFNVIKEYLESEGYGDDDGSFAGDIISALSDAGYTITKREGSSPTRAKVPNKDMASLVGVLNRTYGLLPEEAFQRAVRLEEKGWTWSKSTSGAAVPTAVQDELGATPRGFAFTQA